MLRGQVESGETEGEKVGDTEVPLRLEKREIVADGSRAV